MLRQGFRTGLLVGCTCILSTPIFAQSFGQAGAARGGTGSAFGGGTSAFGGGMGGSGGFGGSGFGGRGFGGQTGMGGGAFGGGGFGAGATGQGGFITEGQNQFLLGNQATGGFVGREAADAQQAFGGVQGGRTAQQSLRDQARRQQFQAQNNARQGRGRRADQAPQLRITLRVGFQPPAPTRARAGLSGRLQQRVSRTLRSRVGVTDPTIVLDGQTVILRGTVASEEERSLAEQVLSLEPGVTTVRNELQVVPPLPPPPSE